MQLPTLFLALCIAYLTTVACGSSSGTFNQAGNVLISDQFNNRVIEVNPKNSQIIWTYGLGPNDLTDRSPLGVNDAERIGNNTLISCTGIPAGATKNCAAGCADNRVILVDEQGSIIWQYGSFGVTGSGHNQLNTPVQSTYLSNGNVLITDQGNQRVIQVDQNNNNIIWQYGTTGKSGIGNNQLNSPNSAELLSNGNVLIADENNNRVIEVDQTTNKIVATFTIGGTANIVAFASRLPDGNTLITDSGNNRVVIVDANDNLVWSYATNSSKSSNKNPAPTRAVQLSDGTIVISDQYNNRVIFVSQSKSITNTFGVINKVGYSTTTTTAGLYAPYDAKVVGDYTGLTDPGNGNGNGNGGGNSSASTLFSFACVWLIALCVSL